MQFEKTDIARLFWNKDKPYQFVIISKEDKEEAIISAAEIMKLEPTEVAFHEFDLSDKYEMEEYLLAFEVVTRPKDFFGVVLVDAEGSFKGVVSSSKYSHLKCDIISCHFIVLDILEEAKYSTLERITTAERSSIRSMEEIILDFLNHEDITSEEERFFKQYLSDKIYLRKKLSNIKRFEEIWRDK